MIRHRDGGSARSGGSGLPTSPYDLGRSLRRIRTRQGLRMEDISARTGLPLDQLALLESGTVNAAADRVAVLRTLRRYADFLGLPGDRYVLVMIDHWPQEAVRAPAAPPPQIVPLSPTAATTTVAAQPRPFDTGTVPVTALGAGQQTTGVVPGVPGVPGVPVSTALPAGAPTGVVPATGAVPTGDGPGDPWAVGGVPHEANTGMIAAVPPLRREPERHRTTAAPLALRLAVIVVAVALLAGVAGLVIHRYEPSWLNTLGITHATTPGSGSGGGRSTGGGNAKPAAPVFSVASTSLSTAQFTIRAPAYLVGVVAAGNPSWIQATKPPPGGSGPPSVLYAGTLPSGQTKDFLVTSTMTLEVGSSAAHVYVSVGKKLVGFYYPHSAPFTMNFRSAG